MSVSTRGVDVAKSLALRRAHSASLPVILKSLLSALDFQYEIIGHVVSADVITVEAWLAEEELPTFSQSTRLRLFYYALFGYRERHASQDGFIAWLEQGRGRGTHHADIIAVLRYREIDAAQEYISRQLLKLEEVAK